MATELIDNETPIYPLDECKRFARDCFEAVGANTDNAEQQATLLIAADYRGLYNYGMKRLEAYLNDIQQGFTDSNGIPQILNECPATAWVDGHNGLGAVVGNFCMNIAIKKAKEVGVGWVCAKNSNHYGIASYYTLQAVEEGLIGISTCNTPPIMTPTRGLKAALGSNPLSFAAPGKNKESFVLDMATTVVTLEKIEESKNKGESIPVGWAMDNEGNVTSNAEQAMDASALLPLGGQEEFSGYKGYGLGLMVEVMSGILSDSNYSVKNKNLVNEKNDVDNLGQCFIALNPTCFANDFETRMSDIMNILKSMEPADPDKPVLVHGDKERMHMRAVDAAGGIKYLPNLLDTCKQLAEQFNIMPLRCKCKNKNTQCS